MHRIVFISTMEGSPWGGSEELWSQAAMRLIRQQCAVGACVKHWDGARPPLQRLAEAGIATHSSRPKTPVWERAWRKFIGKRNNFLDRTDATWLKQQRASLVCISQGGIDDGLPWMLHCRNHGIPYVVVAQANAEWLWPSDEQAKDLIAGYLAAQQCCFVSRKNRELFEDQVGQELPNASLIYNPCNVRWDAAPAWPDNAPDWRLACVARLDPVAKGQDILLNTLALPKWRERNLKISLYGSGRCEQSLRKLAARLNLTSVDFVGQVSDVEKIWAENHALVLPSRYEGTPLAVVEAMFCKRPCIVTDVAGNSELVEHGISGFVAPGVFVTALDEALEQAWQQRSHWKEMGEAGRARITALMPEDPIGDFCECLLALINRSLNNRANT